MTDVSYKELVLLRQFSRHDRDYWLFTFQDNPYTYIYFSHSKDILQALFFGQGFTEEIPRIEQDPDLCIECGLGTRIRGGVSLDGGDYATFHCSIGEANEILAVLRERLGDAGEKITSF